MGANESKGRHGGNKEFENTLKNFGQEELEKWRKCFHEITGNSQNEGSQNKKHGREEGAFSEQQLAGYTKPVLSEFLRPNLMTAFETVNSEMAKHGHHKSDHGHKTDGITWEVFIMTMYHLLKADLDERTRIFIILCGGQDGTLTKQQLMHALKQILRAYVEAESKTPQYATWNFQSPSFLEVPNTPTSLAEYFINDLQFNDQDQTVLDILVRWMSTHYIIARMLDLIIYVAFHFEIDRKPGEVMHIPWTIPECESETQTLLTAPVLLLLNSHLPAAYRHKWRMLYTTSRDGESFSTMVNHIAKQGPTLLIVKDEKEYIFGGFNSKNWELSSNWLGDESCFIFSLSPTVAVYPTTGYNKNYCYLNLNQQTMPNGLGFGGRNQAEDDRDKTEPIAFFSIWIDENFGNGRSQGSCTTFQSPRLSSLETFKITQLEVWGVESIEDAAEKAKAQRSILDVDPEARAILEMTGKTRHSEGLRDPEPAKE